jgi:hypothetical protein
VFLLANLTNSVYYAMQVPPSTLFFLLYYVALAWALAAWISADAKRFSLREPFDAGFFVFFAWPALFPYHLLRTRGIQGIVVLLAFVGAWVACYLLSLIVFFAIVAVRSGPH